jgi:hypothetical protein
MCAADTQLDRARPSLPVARHRAVLERDEDPALGDRQAVVGRRRVEPELRNLLLATIRARAA